MDAAATMLAAAETDVEVDEEVVEAEVGKAGLSHELELARASLPRDEAAERSWARVGVESKEFSDPDKIPADPG